MKVNLNLNAIHLDFLKLKSSHRMLFNMQKNLQQFRIFQRLLFSKRQGQIQSINLMNIEIEMSEISSMRL